MRSKKINYHPRLVPEAAYHIYNRGNNRCKIFYEDRNYYFFLAKYARYIAPYVHTYAYCLIPNHFHFLVRLKKLETFLTSSEFLERYSRYFPTMNFLQCLANLQTINNPGQLMTTDIQLECLLQQTVSTFISDQFRLLFMSYAKAINKQENRTGSLFQKNFKRRSVETDQYFRNTLLYIHTNPELHNLCKDFSQYPHSSYMAVLSNDSSITATSETLSIFGSLDQYVEMHKQYLLSKQQEIWILNN